MIAGGAVAAGPMFAGATAGASTTGTIVLTGYSPFGGRSINTAWDVAQAAGRLLDADSGLNVVVTQLPTDWTRYRQQLLDLVSQHHPDLLLGLGERGGLMPAPAMELHAYNQGKGVDAHGNNGPGELVPGGPAEIVAPEANRQAYKAARAEGHKINPSYDAGRYLCNAELYTNLSLQQQGAVAAAGFIHVPALRTSQDKKIDIFAQAVAATARNLV